MHNSKKTILFIALTTMLFSCKTSSSLFATKTELHKDLIVGQGAGPEDHLTNFGIWIKADYEGTYGPSYTKVFSSPYVIYKKKKFIIAYSDKKKIAIALTNKINWESYIVSKSDEEIEKFLGWEISELNQSDTLPITQYKNNYVQRYLDKSW